MTTPVVYGGLGITKHGLGRLGLGGAQPTQSFALPAMSKTARPFIAHLYDRNLKFKRLLGAAAILNKPGLKQTGNGGFHSIVLALAATATNVSLGDVIRLTEQGDNAGTILYSGNVEQLPEESSPSGTDHQITLAPWVSELGDTYFNQNYTTNTDVAQFVRDAVAQTAHLSVSPVSCPNTGITAINNFQQSNALDAIHVAKQIAGSNYFYFVDEQGVVWFQPVYTANPATVTLRRSADFNRKKSSTTIHGMKNKIVVMGGVAPGDTTRLTATYTGSTNIGLYGTRALNPPIAYPNLNDQPTLNAIAASLGAQFDRVLTSVEVDAPALGLRLTHARPGGLTMRIWEPNTEVFQGNPAGAGTYGPTLVVQDIEAIGPTQKIVAASIPYTDTDTAYEATRILQRLGVAAAPAVPTPVLTPPSPITSPPPPPPPAQIVVQYDFQCTPGLYAMGGGAIDLGSNTFTTPRAGTVQCLGSLDARMEAWDNYVSAPRRNVWTEITGIVANSAYEMPFGLTRVTVASNSASGIAIAAGTWTVRWRCDTEGYNQIRVYSGWGRAEWVG